MDGLEDAKTLVAKTSKPYPRDSDEYRCAREALLAEEIELRRHLARVAEQRRNLPLGGEPAPFKFLDESAKELNLAHLFGKHDTLVTYFWMYGPMRERPCPMCTSLLGSLDIPAIDIEQRLALAVIGRSPVGRQLAFARERGWNNLRFYQCVGDDFPKAYRGLAPDGSEWPALDVWVRRGEKVHRFWAGESGGTQDPGQDPHGAPDTNHRFWRNADNPSPGPRQQRAGSETSSVPHLIITAGDVGMRTVGPSLNERLNGDAEWAT